MEKMVDQVVYIKMAIFRVWSHSCVMTMSVLELKFLSFKAQLTYILSLLLTDSSMSISRERGKQQSVYLGMNKSAWNLAFAMFKI